MKVKVSITDLQTGIQHKGYLGGVPVINKPFEIELVGRPSVFRIGKVKGWIVSDSRKIAYVMDVRNRRFLLRSIA